jgi:hypothetical protein
VQLIVEANGPSLHSLRPAIQKILESTRLILSVDSHFDELVDVVKRLPSEGLCVMVSDKFISNDDDFREFLTLAWP